MGCLRSTAVRSLNGRERVTPVAYPGDAPGVVISSRWHWGVVAVGPADTSKVM